MKQHMNKARSQLGELAALSARTEAAERRILSAAEARLDAVQAEIADMQPRMSLATDDEENRYLSLVEERGRLNKVIAKAREALGT